MTKCPSCGASVQEDASFCGQCGLNLKAAGTGSSAESEALSSATIGPPELEIPDLLPPEPLVEPEPLVSNVSSPAVESSGSSQPNFPEASPAEASSPVPPPPAPPPDPVSPPAGSAPPNPTPAYGSTQLQMQAARLLHVQTNTLVELPQQLMVVHLGKPNDRIPPDIDLSGFPNSEIVSRIHADIRVEGDAYYLEDVGSSNGTYINNTPLPMGNRHRLRTGDRIALGKGDRVTFLFQQD